MMQQPIGEIIRQLRRQRSLTQTELGGSHFSKSYVSAVERDKITPSLEALHFFAEQLGQSNDYFIKLKQDTEEKARLFSPFPISQADSPPVQEGFLDLLDILFEGTEQRNFLLAQDLPILSPEMMATLPLHGQAHYSFLRGLVAQEQKDFSTALNAFEHALALAPAKHQPAILDELGNCYYLFHVYQTALGYHRRALSSLEASLDNGSSSGLRLRLELHCGNDYRALSEYEQARTHYEQARQHLNSTHDMKTAAQLYSGLGYSIYAYAYEKMFTTSPSSTQEIEREFQHAISYLLQSRTLYQISGDRMGESSVRLLQAIGLFDLCTIRRQTDQRQIRKAAAPSAINSITLLEEAQEQCQQILIRWQDTIADTGRLPTELETIIFTSLAYLIRTYTQRAAFARVDSYADTANRERSLATHLCQQVFDTVAAHASLETLVRDAIHLPMNSLIYQSSSLPRLPELPIQSETYSAMTQVELYFAAGEVAEELGRAATTHEYALDCFRQADQCYRVALTTLHSIRPNEEYDPGSLLRYYQRCASLLVERIQTASESAEEHIRTLLDILKIGLSQPQHAAVQ